MVPVVLSNATQNAPALSGSAGSLYALFKWALPQLGWTVEFDEGATKIVFRNNSTSGTGFRFRVNDSKANHAATDIRAEVSAYQSMSDVDTGTEKIPTTGERYWIKSHTEDTTPRDWFIIGTDKFFFFLSYNGAFSTEEGFRLHFVGDIKSNLSIDNAPFVLSGNSSTSTNGSSVSNDYDSVGSGEIASSHIYPEMLIGSSDGVQVGVDVSLMMALPSGIASAGQSALCGRGSFPDPLSGGVNTSVLEVFDNSAGSWNRRGYLPGFMAALSDLRKQSAGTHGLLERDTLPGLATPDGPQDALYFYGVGALGAWGSPAHQYGIVIIETADWDNL